MLEDEGYGYAIRLKHNPVLEGHIRHLLTRAPDRPPNEPQMFYQAFTYQAGSWDKPRRVAAKVVGCPEELIPQTHFIVTNLGRSARRVFEFYNGRGAAEQWIKEGDCALNWTRLSCRRCDANQARLQLLALACNLANFMRRLILPPSVRHRTLTTLLGKLIKIGAKVVRHARYVRFQLAEVAVPRKLFDQFLRRIERLRQRAKPPPAG